MGVGHVSSRAALLAGSTVRPRSEAAWSSTRKLCTFIHIYNTNIYRFFSVSPSDTLRQTKSTTFAVVYKYVRVCLETWREKTTHTHTRRHVIGPLSLFLFVCSVRACPPSIHRGALVTDFSARYQTLLSAATAAGRRTCDRRDFNRYVRCRQKNFTSLPILHIRVTALPKPFLRCGCGVNYDGERPTELMALSTNAKRVLYRFSYVTVISLLFSLFPRHFIVVATGPPPPLHCYWQHHCTVSLLSRIFLISCGLLSPVGPGAHPPACATAIITTIIWLP